MYQLKYALGKHEKAVSAVSFSPCGKFVASASADRIIHIFNTITPKIIYFSFIYYIIGLFICTINHVPGFHVTSGPCKLSFGVLSCF